MLIIQIIEFLRQRMNIIILLSAALLILLIIIDALPFIVDKQHAHTAIEHIPGFWAIFGFLACLAIIFVSKWYGHLGIMQGENYYNNKHDDNAHE